MKELLYIEEQSEVVGISENLPIPHEGEVPSHYAERLGNYYSSTANNDHKKDLGQFFTPLSIAQFMANFGASENGFIKILDPGCGIGILSIALIEELISRDKRLKSIELVAFETDSIILPLTDAALQYLRDWLDAKSVGFTFFLCKNDFILHNANVLNGKRARKNNLYDIIISNPPYFKLSNDNAQAIAARKVIYGQTNIYTIFLLVSSYLLKESGQLIFITPRSFCSGEYFRTFRELFFSVVYLDAVHVFGSRKVAFKKDKILQENIIISARKQEKEHKDNYVSISASFGIDDIENRRIKRYRQSELLNWRSYQKILHLPVSDTDDEVINVFRSWTGSLMSYGLGISTGPVVDFRSAEFIRKSNGKAAVPLIWLHNIEQMMIKWPEHKVKGKPKGQYILNSKKSCSRLVPNRNYVIVRRFSSKEDESRLIAAPFFKCDFNKYQLLGIENHLNYIYRIDGELSEIEVWGISAILNSRLFDIYFRTFNGNLNVSATELKSFPLPDWELINTIGEHIVELLLVNEPINIDLLVADIFNIDINVYKKYK